MLICSFQNVLTEVLLGSATRLLDMDGVITPQSPSMGRPSHQSTGVNSHVDSARPPGGNRCMSRLFSVCKLHLINYYLTIHVFDI